MGKKKMMGYSVWALGLVVLALIVSPAPASAFSCKDFIKKLLPCRSFLVGRGSSVSTTSSCCDGARDLNGIVSSSYSDRKSLVMCLTKAAKSMRFKAGKAKQLPKLCNINSSAPILAYLD